ncbi:SDR family NAD(P)-dependent oxidoreductase [Paenibacillus sp. J2TS4]|uniref:SDR family NAD(P)-dependent oxidoreductase n=1 Tax=Paenibacillus sp. J2TS4 TaxID=2807194 RepID=UPI001B138489|nr:SDR family NAD(P)-dependent oxidoreductase [Paenibacillus sp. J2TS4]GIP31767.1 oxidoreductase [Paenibacillus sp. J2TS4]
MIALRMLQGKVILITGCLGAAGRSALPMFLERGAILFGCDIHPIGHYPEIVQLKEEYGEQRFVYKQADICDEDQVIAVMSDIDRSFGRLDGTYHNVYRNVEKPAVELSLAEWEDSIRGTLTSTFMVCKYALPLLIRSGGGSIVNMSSILGQIPITGCYAYGAAKAGVIHFTRVLALDYAQYGVRANTVIPGDFRSAEVYALQTEQHKEAMRRNAFLGRSGMADEINEVAAFLLSDASSYVTGSSYHVDGGFHL